MLAGGAPQLSIYERSLSERDIYWQQMGERRAEFEEEEQQACTFKPSINRNYPTYDAGGVLKNLEKRELDRRRKIEQLAELIGTKQPDIARLEDADYQGHSLTMLHRIATALNQRLEIVIPPNIL